MRAFGFCWGVVLTLILGSCYWDSVEALHPSTVNPCDSAQHAVYSQAIQVIISGGCLSCHNSSYPGGGVVLDSYSAVKHYCENGQIMKAVQRQSGVLPMPPADALPSCQIDKLTLWIINNYPE
jgi:hypothetical protein